MGTAADTAQPDGKVKWTSGAVVDLLRTRYADRRRYCFMEQVPSGTGRNCYSWVDAAAMCLWPSDGLARFSFEVKVSRSDFLNEVRNPSKNEFARKYFHAFYYVAPAGVIKQNSEVPEGAGYIEAQKGRLVTRLEATWRKEPDIDAIMLAAFMRAASNSDEKSGRDFERKILAESSEYKVAAAYKNGVGKFLGERDAHVDRSGHAPPTTDAVYAALLTASMNKEDSDRMDKAVRAVTSMQDKLLAAWDALTIAAVVPLLDTSEDVEELLKWYGGDKKRVEKFYKNNDDKGRAHSLDRLVARARAIVADKRTGE